MKMLKAAIFVGIGLFIFISLISLLIPSNIITAKAVTVQSDSLKVFEQIANLKNWKHWHPFFKSDTNNFIVVNDTLKWSQNNKPYCMVVVEKKYPTVKINLQQAENKSTENIFTIMPVQEQGNFQVQWQSITHLKWYPWEKFSGIFIEKMAGSGNEEALQGLKNLLNQ